MEIDRRKSFRFSEWAPESGSPESEDTDSEGTEIYILGLSSSELNNEFFSTVMKTYSKLKQCGILLQLLQRKYKSPQLEFQLEEPWLRSYNDNKFFLIVGLLYHSKKHTSALTVRERDHISLILKKCVDFPYMGHMCEDRTKERVASTGWWPKWEQEGTKKMRDSFLGTFTIIELVGKNAVEVRLTEELSRKHPVFPVSLVKPYFQKAEDKFPSRKKASTPPDILEVEDSPGPVKRIIKARKIRLNGK
ncbi:hypothetical protein O181_005487 [Austropuccinia psidii MF-1]|uniref:Tf2-1-like SH3-like domain-containing protein n=1 Tax=Austropuccinia psidii MF-1 TaxID=1389203 RepID=A0A9Q3BI71_9BASI|nr:hypothetical protein [Austropuccinia psidii MF-1]